MKTSLQSSLLLRRRPVLSGLSALATAWAALSWIASARAATVINSAPFVITESGDYELGADLNFTGVSGTIIQVNASNVTLDFKGHFIAGPVGNQSQQVIGIQATERSNLTIKNGTIAFCNTGVFLTGNFAADSNNVGHRIEKMRVTYCTVLGLQVVAAPGAVISDCQITKIGGVPGVRPIGVALFGAGAAVVDCSIGDVATPGTDSIGISLGNNAFAVRNRIARAVTGILSGKYQSNLTLNVAKPFVGGTDAAGNN